VTSTAAMQRPHVGHSSDMGPACIPASRWRTALWLGITEPAGVAVVGLAAEVIPAAFPTRPCGLVHIRGRAWAIYQRTDP
jgi:hypothetical protein